VGMEANGGNRAVVGIALVMVKTVEEANLVLVCTTRE